MNFGKYEFAPVVQKKLTDLLSYGRMPHSVLISGGDGRLREETAEYISAYAVCTAEDRPCFNCRACHKATERIHPDIEFVKGDPDSKKQIYSKKVLDELTEGMAVRPNEAERRVYVFLDADEKLPAVSQNALLKTLEEPSADILFILTCRNPSFLLETVLSRCAELALPVTSDFSAEAVALAEELALAVTDINEYKLMTVAYKLTGKTIASQTLSALRELMGDCLLTAVGGTPKNPLSAKLVRRLTREKLLGLINTLDSALKKLESNVNMNLLSVWLCTEFRRIIWQK